MAKKKITLSKVYDMVLDVLARHEIPFIDLLVEVQYKYLESAPNKKALRYYMTIKQELEPNSVFDDSIFAFGKSSEMLLMRLEAKILEVKAIQLKLDEISESELVLIEEE